MDVIMVKGQGGTLRPACPDDEEKLRGIKLGTLVGVKVARKNNPKFHRKLFALLGVCWEYHLERSETGVIWRGRLVKPSFERLRADMLVRAGHYDPVFSLDGSLRLEPRSLSFAKCADEEKEKVYGSLIDVALKDLYDGSMTREELDEMVERVLNFDR
jgi:Protein of unknown function (DUF1367)